MRKVSFGSFALTEIKKEDRRCLDRYLIKTFSDNISIADAVRNLAITKSMMYITPDALMRDWLGSKGQRVNRSARESNSLYEGALKRAFFILKEFYSKVKDAPFYKEFIYYPIYIEKIEKVTAEGSDVYDSKYTDVTMNYSFIILSNDLTKNLKMDEIRYDENASLNFLYLFVEFFSSGEMKQSIHDFKQADYEFLIKLYQFTEKSKKEPIQMVLDLYKIIGMLNKIDTVVHKDELIGEVNKFFDGVKIDDLKKYKGLLRHKFVELIKSRSANPINIRETFIDLMNSVFNSEGLSGLYDGVNSNATRGERHQHIYNVNKYREILNIAKELVEYNKIKCNQVITDDNLEIDFRVESNDRSLDIKTGTISQKYQTFFKDYLDSIKLHIDNMVGNLIKEIGAETRIDRSIQILITDSETEVIRLTAALAAASPAGKNQAEAALRQEEDFLIMLRAQKKSVGTISASINKSVSDKISDHLIASMATDLTFVFDDGKRFFTNELVAKGLINLASSPLPKDTPVNCDITDVTGFANTVRDAADKSKFPEMTTENGAEVNNPAFFAASIVKNLGVSFQVLAEETRATFEEVVEPILQTEYERIMNQIAVSNQSVNKNKNSKIAIKQQQLQMDATSEILIAIRSGHIKPKLDDAQKKLHIDIFQNKFVDKVLKKFLKLFTVKQVKQVIDFEQSVSQLHPLIKKLLNNKDKTRGGDCQFFKSFIIDYEMVEQLYRLKFMTDTQKFLDGLINRPPRNFNDPMNRMQTVLYDYLGLQYNPVWIISQTELYMSMPDDLSLTGTSILSKIPKADLMKVCKIDMGDYWSSEKMGDVARMGNPKIKRLSTEISKIQSEIEDLKKENLGLTTESVQIQIENNQAKADLLEEAKSSRRGSKNNNKPKNNNNKNNKNKNNKNWSLGKTHHKSNDDAIKRLQKKIDSKEEEIQRTISDFKQDDYSVNMTLLDDPYLSEREPLLDPSENKELMASKEEMRNRLMSLNPYDDDDVREMERTQARIEGWEDREDRPERPERPDRLERSHPFDFEDRGLREDNRGLREDDQRPAREDDWLNRGVRSPDNSERDRTAYGDQDRSYKDQGRSYNDKSGSYNDEVKYTDQGRPYDRDKYRR